MGIIFVFLFLAFWVMMDIIKIFVMIFEWMNGGKANEKSNG
jgi:hypothetical protein